IYWSAAVFVSQRLQNLPSVCNFTRFYKHDFRAGRSVATLNDIHVLVVDDNKQMRFLVRCLLRAGGINKVTEAETGAQAFDVMRARPVDLIIVDWKMAPVDGLAFTHMVRRNHDSPNPYVPILMLTAHTEISRVAAARDAG